LIVTLTRCCLGWTGMDATCEKPDGAGLEEQKLPAVTMAGM
jgi:hypothetical protein